jgi:hypothetical protein
VFSMRLKAHASFFQPKAVYVVASRAGLSTR